MTLTTTQIDELNHMIPGLELGTMLAGLQSAPGVGPGSIGTTQIAANAIVASLIAAAAVTAPKAKYVTRTLTIAIGAKTATVTNVADINGIPSVPYFPSAILDATGNEIVSFQFVPSTGQIIATLNANATAAVTVNVPILQAV